MNSASLRAKIMDKPYMCIHCGIAGTLSDQNFREHFVCNLHDLCVHYRDPFELYCFTCGDFQFCSLFDKLVGKKRGREPRPVINGSYNNKISLKEETDQIGFRGSRSHRGLLNMGSTCFMNSVLEILIHSPLISNNQQLLSHRNHCLYSNRSSSNGETSHKSEPQADSSLSFSNQCIPCELTNVLNSIL